MSFSFQVRAADKAAVLALIDAQMDTIIQTQPNHVDDKPLVLAVSQAYLDLVMTDDTKDIMAHINGSLSWMGTNQYTGANVGVSMYLVAKDFK